MNHLVQRHLSLTLEFVTRTSIFLKHFIWSHQDFKHLFHSTRRWKSASLSKSIVRSAARLNRYIQCEHELLARSVSYFAILEPVAHHAAPDPLASRQDSSKSGMIAESAVRCDGSLSSLMQLKTTNVRVYCTPSFKLRSFDVYIVHYVCLYHTIENSQRHMVWS